MHVMSTKEEASHKWLMFSKFWLCYNEAQEDPDNINRIQMNHVFANCSEEDEIYPLTVKEIAEAQKTEGLELLIIEYEKCICNKGKLVIPKPLHQHAVMWYCHYLQHLGHTCLEESMKAVIYWKGIRNTI